MPKREWPYPDGQGKWGVHVGSHLSNISRVPKPLFSFLNLPADKIFPYIGKWKKDFNLFKLLASFSPSPKTRRICREVCLRIGSDMRTTLPLSGARIKMDPLDILTGQNPPGNREASNLVSCILLCGFMWYKGTVSIVLALCTWQDFTQQLEKVN